MRNNRAAVFVQRLVGSLALCLIGALGFGQRASSSSLANSAEFQKRLEADWRHLRTLDEECKMYEVANTSDFKKPDGTSESTKGQAVVRIEWPSEFRYFEAIRNSPKARTIYARNPSYAFTATKQDGAAGWRLEGYDKSKPADNPIDQLVTSGPNRALFYPLTTTIWDKTPLDEMLSQPHFHIQSVNALSAERTRIRFKYKQPSQDLKKWLAYEGFIDVNPRLSSAVEEWNILIVDMGNTHRAPALPEERVVRSSELGFDSNGAVICRRITQTAPRGVQVWTYSNYDRSPFSKEPFRLNYYGLPEPVDVPAAARSIPRYVWLLATSLACVVAAVVTRRLAVGRPKNMGTTARANSARRLAKRDGIGGARGF